MSVPVANALSETFFGGEFVDNYFFDFDPEETQVHARVNGVWKRIVYRGKGYNDILNQFLEDLIDG